MKNKTVELISKDYAHRQSFEISHAERILTIAQKALKKNPKNVSWELPENSKYEFVDGKLVNKSDKGKNRKTSTKKRD